MRYTWKTTGIGVIDNLGRQLEKVLRGMRQGSIATQHRVKEASIRFVNHVATTFRLKNLRNMQDKHLESYVKHLQDKGCSDKYIKTELSCLRTLHNHIINPRHELTESQRFNQMMGLGSTPDGRADRSWTDREFEDIKVKALMDGHKEIANVLTVCRMLGLRLDEACTLRLSDLEYAVRTSFLHLTNTKGGRPRTIPINGQAKDLFRRIMPNIKRGHYAFLPQDKEIHKFKSEIEQYLILIRKDIQDVDRKETAHNLKPTDRGALTVHGLRHSALADVFISEIEDYNDIDTALRKTAQYAGHNRKSVSLIYVNKHVPRPGQPNKGRQ